MRTLFLALALMGCTTYPPGYRLPPTPTSYWIWESSEAAHEWIARHPSHHLCVTRVPDGYATRGC